MAPAPLPTLEIRAEEMWRNVLARRLALAIPMLLGMSVIVFLIVHLVPGDPATASSGSTRRPSWSRSCGPVSGSTSRSSSST